MIGAVAAICPSIGHKLLLVSMTEAVADSRYFLRGQLAAVGNLLRKSVALALAATVVSFAATGAASAQSGACLYLSNKLRAIDSGGGFGSESDGRRQQYERAVADQIAQISKTERAARLNGCGGFFQFNQSRCQRIQASLANMNANLDKLRRTRDRLPGSSGGLDRGERNAIVAEMDRLRCETRSAGQPIFAREEPRRRTLLEQLFGVRIYREDGTREGYNYDPDLAFSGRYGTYRTLCVRKCDGYYFPISFSTSSDRFSRDAAICQSMCPDTDVELFFHGQPSQESEDMVSWLTREPYANLSTAFKYRKKLDPQCTCRFRASGIAEIAGSETVAAVREADGLPSRLPVRRPDPGIDPEAVANAASGLTAGTVATLGKSQGDPPPVADLSRKIRVVGPEFFPVQ